MHCTLEPHSQPFFALVIFQIGSCIFAWGRPHSEILLSVLPSSWNYSVYHHPWFN
jgi:hypothetical protein